MSYASRFSHLFDFPRAKSARGKRAATDNFRNREYTDLIELEFSEYGRDSCFTSGWYVVPVFVAAAIVIVALVTV